MTRLMLTFINGSGNRVSLSIPEPKPELTESEVVEAMEEVVSSGLIRPNGSSLVAPHQARIVDNNTTVLYKA